MNLFYFNYVYNYNEQILLSHSVIPFIEESHLVDLNFSTDQPRAVGYMRWSDTKQTDKHSFEIQLNSISAAAKRKGYDAIALFVDKATSAYRVNASKRKAVARMIQYIEDNPTVETMFFYDESRLSRKIYDFYEEIFLPIKELRHGFKFRSTLNDSEWDPESSLEQLKLTLAYGESQLKSDRVTSYINETLKSEKPRRPGSKLPYGYKKKSSDNEEFEPDENAKIVVLMYYLYSFGYSDKKIAQLLSESQIPSPTTNKEWSDSSVRYILTNRWYVGDMTWNARTSYHNSKKKSLDQMNLFRNHHEALIGEDLWELVQFFRNEKLVKSRFESPFFLRGLVMCVDCNTELTSKNMSPAKSKKQYNFYICKNCKYKVEKADLEERVLKDFSNKWKNTLHQNPNVYSKTLNEWEKKLCKSIQEKKQFTEELTYKLSTKKDKPEIVDHIMESYLKELEESIKGMNSVLDRLGTLKEDAPFSNTIIRLNQELDNHLSNEKRAILISAIKQIQYDKKLSGININYRLTPYIQLENSLEEMEII
ncbi:hypothetical protein CHH49_10905 [Terribacillus saccharophilus]|uniref:recombinase family protein n=1 Tax=Terribacillus saccharophilus TaxID=361277 RepID=UPI000BA78C97|nr:recombinase family protein [Terribacillus saccharophilus]PAF21401.1 hypothetical protein CHH49_10905 [Terribacillus saccharophilus]